MDEALLKTVGTSVGIVVLGTALTFVIMKIFTGMPRRMTYLKAVVADANHDFIHIFGAQRVMPDEGDSFDIWYHYVFNWQRPGFTLFQRQRGDDLELDSPFVERSLKGLSTLCGHALSLGEPLATDGSSEDTFQVQRRSTSRSDTEKPVPPPRDGIVFLQGDRDDLRFRVQLYKDGQPVAGHAFKGDSTYSFYQLKIPEKEVFLFTYRKGGWAFGGMALCMLDTASPAILYDDYIIAPLPSRTGKNF